MDTQHSGFVAESSPQDVTAPGSEADVDVAQSSGLLAESQSRIITSGKETESEAAQSLGPQAKMQSHNSSCSKSIDMEAAQSSGFMASESQDMRTPSEEAKPKTTQSSNLRVRWKSQVTTSSNSIAYGLEGAQSSGLLADSKSTDTRTSIEGTETEAAESSGRQVKSQSHDISSSTSIETEAAKSSGARSMSQSHNISSSKSIETEAAESSGARAKTQSHNTSSNKIIEMEAAQSSGFIAKSKSQDTGTSSEETKPKTSQSSSLRVRWKSQVTTSSKKTEKEAARSSGPAPELQSHSSENIVRVASSTRDHGLTDSPTSSDDESVYVDAIASLHHDALGGSPQGLSDYPRSSHDSVFASSYYSFNLIGPNEDNAVDALGGDSPGSSKDEAASDDNAEETSDDESVFVDAVVSVPADPVWGSTESSVQSEASEGATAQIIPPIPQIVLTPPDHEVDRIPPTFNAGLLYPAVLRMHIEVRPASRDPFLGQNSLSSEYTVRSVGLGEEDDEDDDVGESAHIEDIGEVGDSDF